MNTSLIIAIVILLMILMFRVKTRDGSISIRKPTPKSIDEQWRVNVQTRE